MNKEATQNLQDSIFWQEETPSLRATFGGALILVALFISYALRSTGTYQDDDIAHFLIAKWSWQHPQLLLDVWGRPTFTLLYAPIAPFGLLAVRCFSAFLAGIICIGSAFLAKAYRLQWYWLAVPLTGLQPEFMRQAFSSLTELSFALCLCFTLLFYKKRAWTAMALVAGWLPLARYESIPILALFTLLLLKERRYWQSILTLLPLFAWNSYWAFALHDWTHILFPFDRLFIKESVGDYGTGTPWYYVQRLPIAYGSIIFLLATYGFFRLPFDLSHLSVILTIAVLSISYSALPSAGVAGYIRHLATISPAISLFALAGLEKIYIPITFKRVWQTFALKVPALFTTLGMLPLAGAAWLTRKILPFDQLIALFIGLSLFLLNKPLFTLRKVALALFPLLLIATLIRIQPFDLTPEQHLVIEAANWYRASAYQDRLILGSHTLFVYTSEIDPYDEAHYRAITPVEIAKAPAGSLIVWDSHYSNRLVWKTPLNLLQNQAQFQLLQSFQKDGIAIYIFLKKAVL